MGVFFSFQPFVEFRYAWGQDELKPVSARPRTTFGGCTAITIIDAADTLLLMGLMDRFDDAKHWIAKVNFSCIESSVSTFETTIRSLGGLISLYELTGKYQEKHTHNHIRRWKF